MRTKDVHIHLHGDAWSEEARKAAAEARRGKAKATTEPSMPKRPPRASGLKRPHSGYFAAHAHAEHALKTAGYKPSKTGEGSWVHPSGKEVEVHHVGGGFHSVLPKGVKPDKTAGARILAAIGRNPD
jgi:hypothetical protein